MMQIAKVDAAFSVMGQSMDVCVDQFTGQKVVAFKFALTVPFPQLLQQLMEIDQRAGPVPNNFSMPGGGLSMSGVYTHVEPPGAGPGTGMCCGGGLGGMPGAAPSGAMLGQMPGSLSAGLPGHVPGTNILPGSMQQMTAPGLTAPGRPAGGSPNGTPPPGPPGGNVSSMPSNAPSIQRNANFEPTPAMPKLLPPGLAQGAAAVPPVSAPRTSLTSTPQSQPAATISSPGVRKVTIPTPSLPNSLPEFAVAKDGSEGPNAGQPSQSNILLLNAKLIETLQKSNIDEARMVVSEGADVNAPESAPTRRTPLHHALEAGGHPNAIYFLLQARANVNATTSAGKTPCHYAIEQYASLRPVVLRMLLCARGDLSIKDSRGMTPLDNAKMVAIQSCQPTGSGGSDTWVRQMLSELTENPTVTISMHRAAEVRNIMFADFENDKMIFHTESAVCLYSLKEQRTIFMRKLKQMPVRISVQHVSVNPYLGTVAVCLEMIEEQEQETKSVTIIWPNGRLMDEEPLKLCIRSDSSKRGPDALPACVLLSRCPGVQMLFGRLCGGEIYCWRLNPGRSQLVSEVKLMSKGGLLATSDDGKWIAVENREEGATQEILIWSYVGVTDTQSRPTTVFSIEKRPAALAVMQEEVSWGTARCTVAIVEHVAEGMAPPPIEVYSVDAVGQSNFVYRVRNEASCVLLSFCHGKAEHLLGGYKDGLVVLYNLPEGTTSISHDSPNMQSLAISTDLTLLASAEANYFRVYRAPAQEAP